MNENIDKASDKNMQKLHDLENKMAEYDAINQDLS